MKYPTCAYTAATFLLSIHDCFIFIFFSSLLVIYYSAK